MWSTCTCSYNCTQWVCYKFHAIAKHTICICRYICTLYMYTVHVIARYNVHVLYTLWYFLQDLINNIHEPVHSEAVPSVFEFCFIILLTVNTDFVSNCVLHVHCTISRYNNSNGTVVALMPPCLQTPVVSKPLSCSPIFYQVQDPHSRSYSNRIMVDTINRGFLGQTEYEWIWRSLFVSSLKL